MSNDKQQHITQSKIIVAIDFAEEVAVTQLIDQLKPEHCKLKVGKELFTRLGPRMVRSMIERGFDVFLDLKYHDIPNTVAKACVAAADLGVWMINVHAQGGRRMLEAAADALARRSGQQPLLIAVTVLTSLEAADLKDIGILESPEQYALRLAGLAQQSGLHGVVCSPLEVKRMRSQFGSGFTLVTPGIRLAGAKADDQRRTLTPTEAILAGADYLVIGRPITEADNPVGQLLTLNSDISLHSQGI